MLSEGKIPDAKADESKLLEGLDEEQIRGVT